MTIPSGILDVDSYKYNRLPRKVTVFVSPLLRGGQAVKLRAAIGLALIFAYVISPIDIIPDFIPFSGWLDDIIVVPLVLALVRRFTPRN